MKHTIAIFACLLTAAGLGGIARGGVVIDEQVTTTQGNAPAMTHTRELMVQGHKEKMVSERNMFVIDLDKGTMMLIDPSQKAYAEMPFPPHGMMNNPGQQLDLNFQKTGKTSKVLDYPCQEYSAAGKTAMAAVSTSGCFSTSAPGAAEFTEFTQAMGIKLKNARAMAGKMPSGIPLTMDSRRTMNAGFSVPGMAPDQAARLKEMMAKQGPQTTKTVVTKIASRGLPADTFTAPAGYERRAVGGGPGAPPPAGAG
ncbi:MAG TPA: DUF4412 domain-containing protein, partial [Candidatus Binataceae bacterium]|nr:DUF4412 domain-containing protein [Candidatus Binataceae bacterium]